MNISVKVKPKAKKEYLKQISESEFEIAVHEQPEKGKANLAVIRKLAKHFQVPQINIMIVSGQTSKNKIIKIETS
ncbi:hypothetical protein CL629_03625 [bacterium]|nr:hypothetical protein [bacterium]|tara:strand:- start:5390 stop:5614 length:225 start_codon:yes stop_codon:yes gene_type:complete